ncbi:MAG: PorV/PorQ family protein [Bacteroidota bacterium]|nr:PorV/PorQ family protein [Bacteroidota bacterium]
MKRYYSILIALFLVSAIGFADEGRKGQAGFQFLKIPIGAKQIAMGNTGFANATGAGAMYWNPAGVAKNKGYEFQFSNVSWFAGVSYQQFTGIANAGSIGTLGFGIQYLAYPDIIETTEEAPGGTGGTFKPYDLALILNFSRQMAERVFFGINLKYINETIALVSADALAFDIGLTYNTGYQGLQFGFAITNYGTKGQFSGSGLRRFYTRPDGPPNQTPVPVLFEADKFELPSSVQAGLTFEPLKMENVSASINADYVVNTFSADKQNLGAEIGYSDMVFLRAGYILKTDFNETSKGNANFGIGVKYGFTDDFRIIFDYAYADLGILDNAQYITVGIQF